MSTSHAYVSAKVGICVGLFLLALLSALAPRHVPLLSRPSLLARANIFASGVFLAVALIHMLAESMDNLAWYADNLASPWNRVPWTMISVSVGIMAMILLDSFSFPGGQASTVGAAAAEAETTVCFAHSAPQLLNAGEKEKDGGKVHHHHMTFDGDSTWHAVLLAAVFSVHSFIAGLALGLETSRTVLISLFVAIAAHKGIESMAVGAVFVKKQVKASTASAVLAVYALATPLGIIIGLLLSTAFQDHNMQLIQNEMLALAAGTFLVIAVTHASAVESCHVSRKARALLLSSGFTLIAACSMLEP